LIVTNHRHAETVRGRLGREPLVVPIGPNVPDAGLSRAAARSAVADRHGVPPQARLLVFFGFVHPVKGVRYLVEALPALRARFGDVRAVVAGGFTSLALPAAEAAAYRAELEDRARTCGVADCVTFTGHLPAGEVSALLRAADAVVLPYTAGVTTKSGALLAAFDHGVPVVATTGDPPDPEIVDGTAVVAAPRVRDAGAVEAAVGRLLADPRLAARVASGGRAVARTRSWPVIAARHGELYRSVAAGGQ
jgi:glycosyltransferase involved in cell wall biosynthesis